MSRSSRAVITEPDAFDILSAVWVLACNDDNPMITYEGIKRRLRLSHDYDVKRLIQSRGELFRRGVPVSQLDEWKAEMRNNRHLPSWIMDLDGEGERAVAIDALSADDIFRSQFRAERDAPRSPVEMIDWGLQHIDRLRKANLESREATAKSWQMWLVFAIGLIGIAVNTLLTLLTRH
jgi:hypothetical protein